MVLEVRDHGQGVPAGDETRIFEPFYRSDFARARTEGGAGLGLAIVAAIARAHGGRVGVRPAAGGGACFWVALPSSSRVPPPPASAPPTAPRSGSQQVGQSGSTARAG